LVSPERSTVLLIELKEIEGVEDMTNYDLFTAAGYAMMGSKNVYDDNTEMEYEEDNVDLLNFINSRKQG